MALIIFFLIVFSSSNRRITPLYVSSLLLIFLVGFCKSIILAPTSGINGSGILKVSPYILLNLSAMLRASSTCCF